MTAPAVDSYQHFNAVKTLLLAPLNQKVYEWGGVPGRKNAAGTTNVGTTPNIYVLLAVERRFAEPSLMVGRASRSGWRIATVSVGRTPGEVRYAQLQVARALEGVHLVIDGHTSTPVLAETPGGPQPDEGAMSAQDTFVYAC